MGKLCRLSYAERQSKAGRPAVHPLSAWLVAGKLVPLPLLTNYSLVLDVDICRFTGDLISA